LLFGEVPAQYLVMLNLDRPRHEAQPGAEENKKKKTDYQVSAG
jgi:hypothetical protein